MCTIDGSLMQNILNLATNGRFGMAEHTKFSDKWDSCNGVMPYHMNEPTATMLSFVCFRCTPSCAFLRFFTHKHTNDRSVLLSYKTVKYGVEISPARWCYPPSLTTIFALNRLSLIDGIAFEIVYVVDVGFLLPSLMCSAPLYLIPPARPSTVANSR